MMVGRLAFRRFETKDHDDPLQRFAFVDLESLKELRT